MISILFNEKSICLVNLNCRVYKRKGRPKGKVKYILCTERVQVAGLAKYTAWVPSLSLPPSCSEVQSGKRQPEQSPLCEGWQSRQIRWKGPGFLQASPSRNLGLPWLIVGYNLPANTGWTLLCASKHPCNPSIYLSSLIL